MHLTFGCVLNLLIGKEKFLLLRSLMGRRANGRTSQRLAQSAEFPLALAGSQVSLE